MPFTFPASAWHFALSSTWQVQDRANILQYNMLEIQVFVQSEFVKFNSSSPSLLLTQICNQCSHTYSRMHFWLCCSSRSSNNVRRPTGQAPHGVLVAGGHCPPDHPVWTGGAVLLCLLRPRTGRGRGHLLGRDWGEDNTVFSQVSAHGRLKLTGQKTGVGTYTVKPFVCITHIYVIQGWVGTYTEMGAYSREYGIFATHWIH